MADEPLNRDDMLVRDALMTLARDVESLDLSQPEDVRASGGAARRRRMLWTTLATAAVVLAVAALGFLNLGRPEALEPVPAGTSTAPVPTSATPSPSVTATSTPTRRATKRPRPTPTAPATPTPSPTPTAVVVAPPEPEPQPSVTAPPAPVVPPECGAVRGDVVAGDATAAALATARRLMDLAVACDARGLTELATRDDTVLDHSGGPVTDAFALPGSEARYRALTLVLAMPSEQNEFGTEWPRTPRTDAEWQRLVDLGLLDERSLETAKAEGTYPGYRVLIAGDGTWLVMVNGD
ncbi:hypothetical protein [Phycicoccus flavus]|uniref:Uncharacterized protein n=1 Tax=Phycicoccus flavus TaxID=2502783 RepID=A0A8T6R264_9MICO|nr:hypothetical protein [Phycicoccus flavus]NHA68529.1 hypothetical protein [Phycicoccus flavus]